MLVIVSKENPRTSMVQTCAIDISAPLHNMYHCEIRKRPWRQIMSEKIFSGKMDRWSQPGGLQPGCFTRHSESQRLWSGHEKCMFRCMYLCVYCHTGVLSLYIFICWVFMLFQATHVHLYLCVLGVRVSTL